MSIRSFEIRACNSCGLRYPLSGGNTFGVRCPHCLGQTRVVLTKNMSEEFTINTRPGTNNESRLHVLLDNVRSAWNSGSILRSADGFGFEHAYFCGITPTPEQEAVQKTSLGAEDTVTWSYHKDAVKLVKGLQKEGWRVLALEEDPRAISIQSIGEVGGWNVVLMIGSEVTGVDPELLDLSDTIFYIPMQGRKRSFNVAIAFGVAASQLGLRNASQLSMKK